MLHLQACKHEVIVRTPTVCTLVRGKLLTVQLEGWGKGRPRCHNCHRAR